MSAVGHILKAGFDLLGQATAEPDAVRPFLFFDGKRFPVRTTEQRFVAESDLADSGVDVTIDYTAHPDARLPKDNDVVRLGAEYDTAQTYTTDTATYHDGSPLGNLTLSRKTG